MSVGAPAYCYIVLCSSTTVVEEGLVFLDHERKELASTIVVEGLSTVVIALVRWSLLCRGSRHRRKALCRM